MNIITYFLSKSSSIYFKKLEKFFTLYGGLNIVRRNHFKLNGEEINLNRDIVVHSQRGMGKEFADTPKKL